MTQGLRDAGMRYELAAVLGACDVLTAMAQVHPDAVVVPLDTAGLALLPVTTRIASEVTPAALCALGPHAVGTAMLPGGSPYAARRRAGWLTGPESGFRVLTPGLAALIEVGSTIGPVAYVEAEYRGGKGRQAAAVWRGGHLVAGPLLLGRNEGYSAGPVPLTVALGSLGVAATGSRDEFEVAGLGRHRRTVDWVGG